MSAQEIYDNILQYVGNQLPINWYVGITNNPERRLNEHNVSSEGPWYYAPAPEHETARAVEQALINRGFSGGNGGGDHTCTFVYAYLKKSNTKE